MQTAQLLDFCFAAKKCEALVHGAEYSSAPTTCISARGEVSCEQKPSSAANCLKAVALTSRREMFRLDFLYRSLCLPARPHAQILHPRLRLRESRVAAGIDGPRRASSRRSVGRISA